MSDRTIHGNIAEARERNGAPDLAAKYAEAIAEVVRMRAALAWIAEVAHISAAHVVAQIAKDGLER
jgi:hypothetical protein